MVCGALSAAVGLFYVESDNCSICYGKSIASVCQDIVAQWSSKNNKSPSEISKRSNSKFFFNCSKCVKEYQAIPKNITNSGILCPCCTNPRLICERDSCDICYKKSFAYHYPQKSRCWSPKNPIPPSKVTKGTDHKYLFNCDRCMHEIEISPAYVNSGKQWCVYCCNTRRMCGHKNCRFCFSNSFASFDPEKVFTMVSEECSWAREC